jgi:hypothetical protein
VYLENIVFDAVDPRTLGRLWEERLGTEPLTDEEAGYETRFAVADGPVLDLCFQRVPEENTSAERLHLDVADGELTAMRLESADPERDREFWAWLSGWLPVDGSTDPALQHPSGRGPFLQFQPEEGPKTDGKNPVHLDLRLEPADDADAITREIAARGGREMHHPEWGELPWRTYVDPSGNEFCILRAPA